MPTESLNLNHIFIASFEIHCGDLQWQNCKYCLIVNSLYRLFKAFKHTLLFFSSYYYKSNNLLLGERSGFSLNLKWTCILLTCLPLAHPSYISPFTVHSNSMNACLLECWQCKGRGVCVEESGTGISYNASALLSVHSFRIYSAASLCFFLALPRLCSIRLVSLFFCISVTRSLLPRRISHSPGLYNLSSLSHLCFPAQSHGFWLLLLHHSNCILQLLSGCAHCVRNQKQTKVGVWRASALGLRLHVFGISLPLSLHLVILLTPLSSCLLSLCSVSQSRDDCACLFLHGSKCYTISVQQHLTLSHIMLVRLLIYRSLSVSELSVQSISPPAALKTIFAYLLILECIFLSILTLLLFFALYECISGFMYYAALLEFLRNRLDHATGFYKEPPLK